LAPRSGVKLSTNTKKHLLRIKKYIGRDTRVFGWKN
jgi:hypothetical protein